MVKRRKAKGAKLIRLGRHLFRLELVTKGKLSEVAGRGGKRRRRAKGHKRGCRCPVCKL